MAEATIKVVVKSRPALPGEAILEKENFHTSKDAGQVLVKNITFSFDRVYDALSTNEEIFNELVHPKMSNLLEGYNVTILAYGTTGSGKTYTMGLVPKNAKEVGLIPLSLADLFKHIEASSTTVEVTLKASFFEIYMEEIKDLLNPNATYVSGDSKEARLGNMKQVEVKSFDDAIKVLEVGSQSRTTAATTKNTKSSRSHAFFIISITIKDKVSGHSKFSKFQLVDLAGSERAVNDAKGKEFKQGIQINKGLSALSRVIMSIYESQSHIPYRDSILTRHLQDSFGGNSLTVMITCVSPARITLEETLNSLRYTNYVKCIKNKPVINAARQEKSIENLQDQLDKYKKIFGNYSDAAHYENSLFKYKEKLNMVHMKFDSIKCNVQEMLGEVKLLSTQTIISPQDLEKIHRILEEISNLLIMEELSTTTTPDTTSNSVNVSFDQINQAFQTMANLSLPSDIDKSKNSFEDFNYENKDLDRVIRLIEIHLDNLKNIRDLYEFTQCEDEKELLLQKIKNKREELNALINQEKTTEDKKESPEKLQEKIRYLEEKLVRLETEAERQQKAAERKEEIAQNYVIMEKKLHDLKQLHAQQHQMHEEEKVQLVKENIEKISALEKDAADLKQILQAKEMAENKEKEELLEKIAELEANLKNIPFAATSDKMSQVSPKTDLTQTSIFKCIEDSVKAYVQLQLVEYEAHCIEEKINRVEDFEKKGISAEKTLSDNESTSSSNELLNNVNNLKTIVDDHKRAVSFNFNSINEKETKPIIEFMYKKYVAAETDNQKAHSELEVIKHQLLLVRKEHSSDLERVEKEKEELQASCERKLLQLNSDWVSKTLVMIEGNRPLSITGELKRQKSPLIKEVADAIKKSEENLLQKKSEELEEKIQEIEKLKKLLEEKTMMTSQLSLPTLAKTVKPKAPTKNSDDSDMVIEFLTDAEESFNVNDNSRLLDPDFRGTPLYKRQKSKSRIKRKAPEEEVEECAKPTHIKRLRSNLRKKFGCLNPETTSPAGGCNCTSNCGSMRCSCRKKKEECSSYCGCKKDTCQNIASSSKA